MDFSLLPLGFDNGYNSSRIYPILMDFIDVSYQIVFYNIPNVKIV
jgi:hypothetical protein